VFEIAALKVVSIYLTQLFILRHIGSFILARNWQEVKLFVLVTWVPHFSHRKHGCRKGSCCT